MVSSEHYFLLTAWLPPKEQHQNPTKNFPLMIEWQLREVHQYPSDFGDIWETTRSTGRHVFGLMSTKYSLKAIKCLILWSGQKRLYLHAIRFDRSFD